MMMCTRVLHGSIGARLLLRFGLSYVWTCVMMMTRQMTVACTA